MRTLDKDQALALLTESHAAHPAGTCVPCVLVAAAVSGGQTIAHDEHGAVLLNRFGGREGHLLVVSRKHVEHVHELSWTEYAELQRLAHAANLALTRVLAPLRVYTAVLGSPAPLAISYPHLHIHVVPVHEADERARPARVFSWSDGVVVYDDDEAARLAARIREAWPR